MEQSGQCVDRCDSVRDEPRPAPRARLLHREGAARLARSDEEAVGRAERRWA